MVSNLYNVNYVIKVDDDSYVRLDRLSIALSQWSNMGAGAGLALHSVPCDEQTHLLRAMQT